MRAFKVAAATVGLSAALTGTAVGLAAPVSAAPGAGCENGQYPPARSTVALSRSRAEVGMQMSYEARCMKPNEKATATVYSTPVLVGTPTVDANGSVSGSFTVPSSLKPGRHTLEIRGLESGAVQSATFIVVPNAAAAGTASNSSDPSSLAFTGSDAAKTAGAGAVLLLGGGALIVAARRRKHVNAAA